MCMSVCVMMILYDCIGAVDFSDNYEELSLHSTTFDKLQRKVQAADVIGKKKLASSEGVLSNFFTVHIKHSASFRIQRVISTSS